MLKIIGINKVIKDCEGSFPRLSCPLISLYCGQITRGKYEKFLCEKFEGFIPTRSGLGYYFLCKSQAEVKQIRLKCLREFRALIVRETIFNFAVAISMLTIFLAVSYYASTIPLGQ